MTIDYDTTTRTLFYILFVILLSAIFIVGSRSKKNGQGTRRTFAILLIIAGAFEAVYFLIGEIYWIAIIIPHKYSSQATPDYAGHTYFLPVLLLVAIVSLSYGIWFLAKTKTKPAPSSDKIKLLN